jgi:LysM repeat protein
MATVTGLPGTGSAYVEYRAMDRMQRRLPRQSGGGPERLVLGIALLVPLGAALMVLVQVADLGVTSPSSVFAADVGAGLVPKRPVSSNLGPPPTLVPPTATPKPTATPVPAVEPTATPVKGGTYTVRPGDELKHIAAEYNVSIWTIINANNIPNPDSLRVGQELKIPSN